MINYVARKEKNAVNGKIDNKKKGLIGSIKGCIEELKDDVRAVKERDPAAKSTVEVMLTYSGLHAVVAYRISHKLYKKKLYLPARIVSQSVTSASVRAPALSAMSLSS